MVIKVLHIDFSICKVESLSSICFNDTFCFIAKTDEEISLVCPTASLPEKLLARDDGWNAVRIEGVLDFSLIGILSAISSLLAENKIGIFAVSTYNTDYILTKAEHFQRALAVLEQNGYQLCR